MSTAELATFTHSHHRAAEPLSNTASSLSVYEQETIISRWQSALATLEDWESGPSVDEDGDPLPTAAAIASAREICRHLMSAYKDPPAFIVSNAQGGITLERRNGQVLEVIRVDAEGQDEYLRFFDGKLTARISK